MFKRFIYIFSPMIKKQEGSKIEELQKQIAKSKKIKNLDDEVEDVISQKNESIKEKKIRELAQKNKSLQLSYEREKIT